MTAKEEVLETIRLWIETQRQDLFESNWDPAYKRGYTYAIEDLTELLDSL